MTPDDDVEKLLGGFATNSLTEQERTKLFAAALGNQKLFDALADEQALKELLDDPRSRRLLIQTLKEKQTKTTRIEKLLAWFQRPWYQQPLSWAVAGGAVVALLAVTVVVHLVGSPTGTPQLTTDATPPVASAPDSPSPPTSGDLPRSPLKGRERNPVVPLAERTPSPAGQQKSAVTTPAGPMNKDKSPESTVPQAPASGAIAPAEKKEQEQYARLERPAPEPPQPESFSAAGSPGKPDANEMTADTTQVPEGKTKAREEARRFSPMGAVTPQETMETQTPTPTIRYNILREEPEGTYLTVDVDTTFQAGDRVRLALEPRDNGYLYVLTRDPSGNVRILFPPDGTGETGRVEKMARYLVPATGAFTFEKPIDQRVTILFSQKRLTDVLSLLDEKTPAQNLIETDVLAALADKDRNRSLAKAPPAKTSDAAIVTRLEITLKHQ